MGYIEGLDSGGVNSHSAVVTKNGGLLVTPGEAGILVGTATGAFAQGATTPTATVEIALPTGFTKMAGQRFSLSIKADSGIGQSSTSSIANKRADGSYSNIAGAVYSNPSGGDNQWELTGLFNADGDAIKITPVLGAAATLAGNIVFTIRTA